ncbi:MAG: hypothetical protein ACRD0J_18975 [Acidimicrobiales bacterium]
MSGAEPTYRDYAEALVGAVDAALPGWVERSVTALVTAYRGRPVPEVAEEAARAGGLARAEVVPRLRALVEADVDAQATTPLALLRRAVSYPAGVLRAAGVPPVERDDFSRAAFPDDDYGLTPSSWGDVDPALTEPGLAWGAAKALAHLRRHRP